MSFSINPADYDSEVEFLASLDAMISHDAVDLAQAISLGIEHSDVYYKVLDEYLLRMIYEHDHDASALLIPGTTIPVTIPLTADMTFIYSDQTEL